MRGNCAVLSRLSGAGLLWAAVTCLVVSCALSAEAADGLQPAEAFSGSGPVGVVELDDPPQIMLGLFTVPMPGAPGLSPSDTAGAEALAQELMSGQLPSGLAINFSSVGGVETVAAADRLYLVVASNAQWQVVATTTDLAGMDVAVPASSLASTHWYSSGVPEPLGSPILAGQGGSQPPRVSNIMDFQAQIDLDVKAGNYSGSITFAGWAIP